MCLPLEGMASTLLIGHSNALSLWPFPGDGLSFLMFLLCKVGMEDDEG